MSFDEYLDLLCRGFNSMNFYASKKSTKFHLKCVVCDKSFGSEYDTALKAYPIYHGKMDFPNLNCEDTFYRVLLGIYLYIFEQEYTVSSNELLKEASVLKEIVQKKEMVTWCLARGFLQVDDLLRIDIPLAIVNEFEQSFGESAFDHLDQREGASEWMIKKLQKVQKDLVPVQPDRIPFKQSELKLGESTLYDRIDVSQVALRRDRRKEPSQHLPILPMFKDRRR